MIKKTLYLLILILFNTALIAQQGKIDITFNTKDDGQNGDGFNAPVRTLLLQRNNHLITGGDYVSLNGIQVSYLTCLNPDGSIDENFNTGTGFNGKVYASYLQEDGKIIVGGSFTTYNGISVGRLIRLNSDGSYDASFNTTVGATTGIVYDIAAQEDGKIIIVGSFTKYNTVTVNRVARLFPNGTLDTSFLTGNGSALNITHVCITSSKKILLTGNFIAFNNLSANRIIRLNENGSIDRSFDSGTGFNDDVNAIALRPDGKIILGGNFTTYKDIAANRIICLNEDGTRDDSFQVGTGFSKEGIQVLKINSNNDVMVGGSFTGFYNNSEVNRLVFLNADGTLNADFDIGTGPASASVLCLELGDDGSWFVGGSFSVFDGLNQGRLVKISTEGERDTAYLSSGIGFDNAVNSILPLQNKKIIVGGNFKKFNGETASRITCLFENGSIDNTFNSGNSGANNSVKTAVCQADGKIILGGSFTKYNDVTVSKIVRITSNGEIDNFFSIEEVYDGQIYTLAVQKDQKIIAAGSFTKYNKSTVNAGRIIRLLPDGTRDPGFNTGYGADGIIETVVVQLDGKILVGGHFKNFNDLPFAGLVRLNSDGSIDTGFNIQEGFDKYVYTIAVQADQKIIVGGNFLTFNRVSQKRILRLNSDGSLDTTFDSGTGFSKGDVRSILIQPDGRILVGGAFSGTYKNVAALRLIRLQPSGDYDNSFEADLNNSLFAMNFSADYRLLVGGNFNSVSGISKHRIAQLKLCVNTTVWNGGSWSNGFPSAGKEVCFKENYFSLTTANMCGCSIDQDKTVVLLEKNNLELEFAYSGLGTLVIEDGASLFQSDDDIVNTGVIHLKRKTTPVMRYDVTYWSSPVDHQKMCDLSPETLNDKYYWYDPLSGWNVDFGGSTTMIPGQGYSIRAPQSYSLSDRTIFEGIFKGVPNNGKVEAALGTGNGYYLVGNPYPSAISADAFLKLNSSKIKGALYFWTHNEPPKNYVSSNDSFAVYNLLGGVATRPSLALGVNNEAPDGSIASGQGFFVKSKMAGKLEFSNNMRVLGSNSAFFKPAKNSKTEKSKDEKYRFWLNLKDNDNRFKQILLGYADGASNGFDENYDADYWSSSQGWDFYSIVENKKLAIQGRGMPWDESDSIVLGYKLNAKGIFYLEVDHQDTFFDGRTIFLIDKTLGKTHNLTELPYEFESEAGTFNERFLLVYSNNSLELPKNEKKIERVLVAVKNHIITIESLDENIKEIEIYDSSGKQLYIKNISETRKATIPNLASSHQVLFVKVFTENGNSISKK